MWEEWGRGGREVPFLHGWGSKWRSLLLWPGASGPSDWVANLTYLAGQPPPNIPAYFVLLRAAQAQAGSVVGHSHCDES